MLTPEAELSALLCALFQPPGVDFHYHRCPRCRAVWSHDREQIPEGGFEAAHSCPKCGTRNCTYKYFTAQEAEGA